MTPRALGDNPVRLIRGDPAELWEIDLPWTAPPLSLNHRGHWHTRARKIREVRQAVAVLARSKRLGPFHRIEVVLHYRPRDRRVRDEENAVPTLKAACDGLMDAGVVPDDRPEYMSKPMPVLHDVDRALEPGLWLTVEALAPRGADRVDVVPPRLRPRLPTSRAAGSSGPTYDLETPT